MSSLIVIMLVSIAAASRGVMVLSYNHEVYYLLMAMDMSTTVLLANCTLAYHALESGLRSQRIKVERSRTVLDLPNKTTMSKLCQECGRY